MQPKSRLIIGNKVDTRTMYIGSERFKTLNDVAIEISYQSGRQITASQMAQYVLDNFLDRARVQILTELNPTT